MSMPIAALVLGVAAIAAAAYMLLGPADWLASTSAALGTKVDKDRYPWGYAVTRRVTPIFLAVWGGLMVVLGVTRLF